MTLLRPRLRRASPPKLQRRRVLSRLALLLAFDAVGLTVALTFTFALDGDLRVAALGYAFGLAASQIVRGWR
jgi:hypothetical protein